PTCPQPTNLSVSGITMNEATFSWTAGATEASWHVLALPAGSPAPHAGTTGWTLATTNPFTLTGLNPGVSYQFYIRAFCSDDDISTWAGPLNFNTVICQPSSQCLYSFIMTDSWGDGWNGNTMTISQNGVNIATIGATMSGSGPITV